MTLIKLICLPTFASVSLVACLLFRCDTADAQVIDGLGIMSAGGTTVTVSPGRCRVSGRVIALQTTAILELAASAAVQVQGESYSLAPTLAQRWGPGTHLKGCSTTNPLPNRLTPGSVRVVLPDGTIAAPGTDYELGTQWATLARLPNGRITTDTQVRVDYSVGQMRIDAICITAGGKAIIVPGTAAKASPTLPKIPGGDYHLANVFFPCNSTSIEGWQLFPVGEPYAEPTPAQTVDRSRPIAHTLKKLRNGEAVTIVTWGDSVTVGGDTSSPDLAYANLFIRRLRQRFPQARIRHVNAGIGATNTEGRLPAFTTEVLAYHPDLVTIEFVNDMDFPEQKLRSNYDHALSELRAIDSDTILITPHFTMPEFMQKSVPRGAETRPAVFTLRSIAAEHGIALADASRRWAHLEQEGIPYTAYLYNGINHPDDRGHELFVKELMTLFPR